MTASPLPAGTWTYDPAHSSVLFKIRHLGLTNVRGRFNGVEATLKTADTVEATEFGATIDISTIDTNQSDRDAHLRSTDFFSADAHPNMTFASTAVRAAGDGYEADGNLTINGITKPITLEVEFNGTAANPADGRERAGFVATTRIQRSDYGIDFNMPLGADKLALGKHVDIEIDVQFIAPTA